MERSAKFVGKKEMVVSFQTALEKSTEYFDGDELAANVFITKYALANFNASTICKFLENKYIL